MENSPIEQLWYTWSDVGFSSVHAGFRIRAASTNLTEIYGDRVQSMDRYMRYVLPPGTDRFTITPDMAPIGLMFVRSKWNDEYILVHKNYLGKDGVGRVGNFFVHVLALGANSRRFSVEDAIWLWGSDIWKKSDDLERRSTKLNTFSLSEVSDHATHYHTAQFQQVQSALQFIIAAYLMRRERTAQLYIAAPAGQEAQIAYIIAGLTISLPEQLLHDLTFSTYEPDIAKASTEIVGTSWIPAAGKDSTAVFPKNIYSEELAVNCATTDRSDLKTHLKVTYNELAAHFAAYAANSLATGNTKELFDILGYAEGSQNLDIASFLQIYHAEIVNTGSTTTADIDKSLSPIWLRRTNSPKKVLNAAIAYPQWSNEQLCRKLLVMRKQAEQEVAATVLPGQRQSSGNVEYGVGAPVTTEVPRRKGKTNAAQPKKPPAPFTTILADLARSAIPEIVNSMEQAQKSPTRSATGQMVLLKRQTLIDTVLALLNLMDACLLAQDPTGVWKLLFENIAANKDASNLLYVEQAIHKKLEEMKSEKAQQPAFIDPLAFIARKTIPIVVQYMDKAEKLARSTTGQLKVADRQQLVDTITILLRSMAACLLPQDPTGVWKQLFEDIVQNDRAIDFLYSDWKIHSWLLKIWNRTFPPDPASQEDDSMRPLLRISWDHLGDFLKLDLSTRHKQWIIIAIQELVSTSKLTPQLALDLGQNHASEMSTLPALLMRERDYVIAANFITALVQQGYPISPGLQPHIEPLLSHLNNYDNNSRRIAKDLIVVLTHTGYTGSPQYQQLVALIAQNIYTKTHVVNQELIDTLIEHDFPQRGWMIDLALIANGSNGDALSAARYVYRTPVGLHSFFVHDGARYLKEGSPSLKREHWISPMLTLYQQLLPIDGRLARLFTLLDTLHDPEAILQVVTNTPLEGDEIEYFLKKYGQSYLLNFQQAPKLANTIVTLFQKLVKSGYRNGADLFFTILPLQTGEKHLEHLLIAANLSPDQQTRFLEKDGANYINLYPTMPLLMNYISTYIANFHLDFPEKEEKRAFFVFLLQWYTHLVLDSTTQGYIQCWKIIDDYLNAPTAQPQMLTTLAQALNILGLPNTAQFSEKLAKAFFSCIHTDANLLDIITSMRNAVKVAGDKASEYKYLYMLARHAADEYEKNHGLDILEPYLLFAIHVPQRDRTEQHFIHLFLDTLFYSLDVLDLNSWKILDTNIKATRLQNGAIQHWYLYLKWLEILDQLNSGAETSSIATLSHKRLSWPKLPAIRRPQLKWGKATKMPPDADGGNGAQPDQTAPPIPQTGYSSDPQALILPANPQPPDKGGNISYNNPSSGSTSYRSYIEQKPDTKERKGYFK